MAIKRNEVEVERARARLVFLARAGETRRARLGSSRQIEARPHLVSSRLANLRCNISSRFTSQKRAKNLLQNWLVWLVQHKPNTFFRENRLQLTPLL